MPWIKALGMHRFVCDYKPTGDYDGAGYCAAEFRSASDVSVLAVQLRLARWTILVVTPGGLVDESKGSRVSDRGQRYLCPAHAPRRWKMPD